ncbi:hypothetical protein SDC9_142614 [bioreactor metagenome]|uniref:Uncharacterized protein n=1 Tax=bioreactor metagenome TaxID=1076179 RepID=A0A645E126_9ZZZZ
MGKSLECIIVGVLRQKIIPEIVKRVTDFCQVPAQIVRADAVFGLRQLPDNNGSDVSSNSIGKILRIVIEICKFAEQRSERLVLRTTLFNFPDLFLKRMNLF